MFGLRGAVGTKKSRTLTIKFVPIVKIKRENLQYPSHGFW